MDPLRQTIEFETRRQFFGRSAKGLGVAALSSLIANSSTASPLSPSKVPGRTDAGWHFAPKAKRAIYLFMSGAPSQIDLWDPKPAMQPWFDKDLPASVRMGQRLTTMTSGQARFPIAPSIYPFQPGGECGTLVSDLLPWTRKIVDKIALVRSVWTEAINHDPAITYIQTGRQVPGRPSLGAWLSYGLGSENADLPSFVVMNATWTGRKEAQALYNRLWGSGMLPSKHAGVLLRTGGDPVLYLANPDGVDAAARRRVLDSVQRLNHRLHDEIGDPETQARIAQYEMAFRMQTSIPQLVELGDEPERTFELYGPDSRKGGTFAHSCLLARRMIERGVRFVQIFHRGWDQHAVLPTDLPNQCRDIDQACYALIRELEERGLLDETLVIWGGEFGRTIYCQGTLTVENYGRDHHPRCFSVWMAGGGIRGGIVHGETDDFSYNIIRDPVHINDLNATILHCLGIDDQRLSVKHQGLDVRLTGVENPRVVTELLA
jgi:hypothetical protein